MGAQAMNDCPLTLEERAYRRGAAQALTFVISHAQEHAQDGHSIRDLLALWHNALKAAHGSTDMRYLGKYLDEVRRDVCKAQDEIPAAWRTKHRALIYLTHQG